MATMAASRTILPVASLAFQHESEFRTPNTLGFLKDNSKSASIKGLLSFKANVRRPTKINSTATKIRGDEVSSPSSSSPSSSTSFLKQLSDFNMFFSPISTIVDDTKPTQAEDEFCTSSGRFVQNGLVFSQNFSIRSYEIGADGRISLEAVMNHLQEAGLNHMKLAGLLGDGLGSTPEMTKRKLIWVATKVQLAIDHYPTWGDDVVIENWIVPSGKNCMRRDSVIRDCKTGKTLIRASSNWVIMNKETRRLSRIPEEVRAEMSPYLMDAAPIIEDDTNKLPKLDEDTSDSVATGLKPRWSDLDINQHVNNAKYIGWVLESAPPAIFENHEISRVTMEYRRECHRDSELESLTAVGGGIDRDFDDLGIIDCNHLLRLADGAEVMKARTEWRPRNMCTLGSLQLVSNTSNF